MFISLWEKALVEGKEVIVMMDANSDFMKWNNSNLPPSDITIKLKSLRGGVIIKKRENCGLFPK